MPLSVSSEPPEQGKTLKKNRTAMAFVALGMFCAGCATTHNPGAILPPEVNGWRAAGPDGVYDDETLFDYINGAAEIYRSFGVRTVVARQYEKHGAPDLVVDLYDMGSSRGAYGAYHHDIRAGDQAGIGHESDHYPGALTFWKGRFFVSIVAFDVTDEADRAMLVLGRTLADAIPKKAARPTLVGLLPTDGLLPSQIHYFQDHILLNVHHFIAEDNVLDLGPDIEGVLGRYRAPGSTEEGAGAPYTVVVIKYPSGTRARRALTAFAGSYLPDADPDGFAQSKKGLWVGVRTSGRYLIGVFDAPSKDIAAQAINAVVRLQRESFT